MESVIARGIQVIAALGGAYLIALWFVLIVWTFRDIETRSRSVITQVFSTLLTVLFFVPGVLLYMILRPKETLDTSFQRSLEEEYLLQDLEELPLCQSCQHYVEADYMICPHCQTRLREACAACARLIDLKWTVCPYCGIDQSRTGDEQPKVPEVAARWSAPVAIRRRIQRQLPAGAAVEGASVRESTVQPTPAAFSAIVGGQAPPPPVRLFDRKKTRESARLNGYRRPTVLTSGEPAGRAQPLLDQFGRALDTEPETLVATDPSEGDSGQAQGTRPAGATKETGD